MASDELHSPLARRPLSLLVSHSPLSSSPSPSNEGTTPGRLKRLSLVAARDAGSPVARTLSGATGRSSTTPIAGPSRLSSEPTQVDVAAESVVDGGQGRAERGHRERESVDSLGSLGSAGSLGSSGGFGGAGNRSSWSRTPTRAPGSIDLQRPPAASPSPRPRHAGRTSSISYSPSVPLHSHSLHHAPSPSLSLGYRDSLGLVQRRDRTTPSPRSREEEEPEGKRSTDALTLGEKHSDLLRMIAMRERRVNELKQELAAQEEALASLRTRWTAIARADAVIPTSTPGPGPRRRDTASHTPTPSTNVPPLVRTHPTSTSTSSTASTLATVPDDEAEGPSGPTAGAALGGLWNAITADADETIQEGKRFWGQLLRTVGAAAGGTIPDETGRPIERVRSGDSERSVGARERRGSGEEGKVELPNFRSMVSSLNFLPPSMVPPKAHTPPLERHTSRSSAITPRDRSPVKSDRSSIRSPSKSPRSLMPTSPTQSVRSLHRETESAKPEELLGPTLQATGKENDPRAPERRLSVRLKRAALSPKPRLLTGDVEKEKEKEQEKEKEAEKGGESPLVAAALESTGW